MKNDIYIFIILAITIMFILGSFIITIAETPVQARTGDDCMGLGCLKSIQSYESRI